MHLIRVLSTLLLLGLAACGTTQGSGSAAAGGGSPIIDEPTPPFPYNSRWW